MMEDLIGADDIFNHMPLDHLIGISLLISVLVGFVLLFSFKVIKEVLKRKGK
jgi:hypothetical protein